MVKENGKQVGDSIQRIRAGKRVVRFVMDAWPSTGWLNIPKRMRRSALNFGNERMHLVDRVIPQIMREACAERPAATIFNSMRPLCPR